MAKYPSSGTKLWKDIRRNIPAITKGYVLAIDPSSGSMNSSGSGSWPGYAIYVAGELRESGVIELESAGKDLPYRLQELAQVLRDEFERPDVLVVEKIAARRYGGGSANSHASLLKAVGVTLATPADTVIEVRPQQWRPLRHESWFKDDEQDAIALGHATLEIANWMLEECPPRGIEGKLEEWK